MAISKIGSKALVDCSVAAVDIEDGSITSAKLAGSIANAKLANSSITVNGSSVSLGASGSIPAVSWQSVITADGSTGTTAVAGNGYFIDTTSAAHTITLPSSPSIGDTVAIKDYAGTFGTNNLTIARNSSNIQGVANDSLISTNRASVTLVYVDSTKGWLYAVESNVADLQNKEYITATGGTVTTSGDYKVHSFTGDGCFVVSSVGNPAGSDSVDYLVVAGGAGSGGTRGGGGGAGGLRIGAVCSPSSPPLVTTGLSVSVTTYPVTVGAGGTAGSDNGPDGGPGSPSVFSTITSAGGGGGESNNKPGGSGLSGGSGGGASYSNDCATSTAGSGNTPPVSPPQGNPGGDVPYTGPNTAGGGGGGATTAGSSPPGPAAPNPGGAGGAGLNVSSVFGTAPQPFYIANGANAGASACGQFAGGGGGGAFTPGSGGCGGVGGGANGSNTNGVSGKAGIANTGGGAGGGAGGGTSGQAGGKGIVLIRYKFQN